jgi:hypothetical protein
MGAIKHAAHFGWENTARKTLDVYDWALSKRQGKVGSNRLNLVVDG